MAKIVAHASLWPLVFARKEHRVSRYAPAHSFAALFYLSFWLQLSSGGCGAIDVLFGPSSWALPTMQIGLFGVGAFVGFFLAAGARRVFWAAYGSQPRPFGSLYCDMGPIGLLSHMNGAGPPYAWALMRGRVGVRGCRVLPVVEAVVAGQKLTTNARPSMGAYRVVDTNARVRWRTDDQSACSHLHRYVSSTCWRSLCWPPR